MVKKQEKNNKVSKGFVTALAIVSIIGFLTIVSESLFYINIGEYLGTMWLVVLGIGLIFESSPKQLRKIKKKGLTPENLGKLIMVVVGGLAVFAGLLSLPQINITNPSFLAVKGIISLLAIVFIIIETWVIE